MKPQCIGIVGGAGPLAGAFLLERIFSLSGKQYGCYKDADFPKVILISFPFSEMLCPEMDVAKIKNELRDCLEQLRANGATVLAIACNTLHAFLDEKNELSNDLVNLPLTLAEEVELNDKPLVLCTSTSVKFGLHKKYFPCTYPDELTQQKVDSLIDQILKGADQSVVVDQLVQIIQSQTARTVILGCTELSIYSARIAVNNKQVTDPLEVMAKKILINTFNKRK